MQAEKTCLLGKAVYDGASRHHDSGPNNQPIPSLIELPLATESQLTYFLPTVNETLNNMAQNDSFFPLSHVKAGVSVRIKHVSGSPEVTSRLREMGFCEEQKIRLISRHTNIICQVCHARLGISSQLADKILVEPLTAQKAA